MQISCTRIVILDDTINLCAMHFKQSMGKRLYVGVISRDEFRKSWKTKNL